MCLLIVLSRILPDRPLVVAANRDELLDRPAKQMTVLKPSSPRVLGGRDLLAGGSWLAVNEHGVVAGLTNSPPSKERAPAKRSRGELPVWLAGHRSAEAAVDAFVGAFSPADYNPAWILVGDRESLTYIDMTGARVPTALSLPAGHHALENRPLGAPSGKVDNVRNLLAGVEDLSGEVLGARLRAVLADHRVPLTAPAAVGESAEGEPRPATAACVHSEGFGTRWSGIVTVGSEPTAPPDFRYTDGPPCTSGWSDATPLWSGDRTAGPA